MDISIAPEILGLGIIVAIGGGLAVVWYLRKKGKKEARARQKG